MKDEFAFFKACKSPTPKVLRGETACKMPIFKSKKGPVEKAFKLDRVSASTPEFLREATKPGCFQTRVFPTFFGTGPDCVADPFGTVPRRCS